MKHPVIFSALVILLVFLVVGCQKEKWPDYEEIDRIEAAVLPVCEGQPLAEAAAYQPGGKEPHPVAQVRIDVNPDRANYVNTSAPWSPRKVAQTELVACVSIPMRC